MNGIEFKNINELSDDFVMDSLQLCDIINKYRQEESKERAELQHRSLMSSIKKEIENLERCGIDGLQNFLQTSYNDSQGKKQPCFALTKFGAMQMLNKESAFVRYKTQQYIEELEYRNSVLEVPYEEMAEDRLKNGFNIKEVLNYIDTASIDDLNAFKALLFKDMGYYPYTAYVKRYFDTTDEKYMEKLIKSNDFKDDGIKTLTTKEFIDLLEKNSITYTSVSGKLKIGDVIVSKGKIKVLSEKALIHLALTIKGSEVAKQYRQFLISNQFIELQQINEITNEKDIKAIQDLQKQAIAMMNRLDERERMLNERESLLNEREHRLNEESKTVKKVKNRIKKLFKIIFGGDCKNKTTRTIVEEPPIIDVEEIKEESTQCEITEYHSPSETRGPICDVPIGRPVPVQATNIPITKGISSWRTDFKCIVKKIAREYNLEISYVYNEAYKELRRKFNRPYVKQNGISIVQTLGVNELRIAIEFLNNKYPIDSIVGAD